jgi:WhiB family redox-sensing transcriptional regulator
VTLEDFARQFRPQPWIADAACRGRDTAEFFPPKAGNSGHQVAKAAKQICRECPVRTKCLLDHLDERFGIWGGATERERRRIRHDLAKGLPLVLPHIPPPLAEPIIRAACGEAGGMALHRRHKERPCRDCLDWDQRRQQRRRAS